VHVVLWVSLLFIISCATELSHPHKLCHLDDMGEQAGGEKAPAARWDTRSSPPLSSAVLRWWARTFSPTQPSRHESSREQKQEGATHVQDGIVACKHPEDGRNDGRSTLMAKRVFLQQGMSLQGNLLQQGWQKLSFLPKF